MARLDEIAEGVASLLESFPEPEPLPMSFRGHTATEIAFLVRAVVAACERLGKPLASIGLPEEVLSLLRRDPDGAGGPLLERGAGDADTVEFRRFPRGG